MAPAPAVAFCPCPPVLVPEVAAGAAPELDALRAACDDVVSRLVAGGGAVTVVGAGAVTRVHDTSAAGSFAGFGVDVRAGGPDQPLLPLSLTVGAWLLDRSAAWSRRTYVELAPHLSAADPGYAEVARAIASAGSLLVMGDGSACRSPKAPGGLVEGAEVFDTVVAAGLAAGDPSALARLDRARAAELMVAGATAWTAVGAVLAEVEPTRTRDGATLLAAEAPYGVAYFVAWWPGDRGGAP